MVVAAVVAVEAKEVAESKVRWLEQALRAE
jgi:hypothetical protein